MRKEIFSLLKTPFTYIFIGVYIAGVLLQSNFKQIEFIEPIFTFVIFFCVLTSAMYMISKNAIKNKIDIKKKRYEAKFATIYFLGWLALFMLLGKIILSSELLSNGFGFWGLLVVLPFIYFWVKGYRLPEFGITKQYFRQNIKISFLACLIVGLLLLLLTPGGKYLLHTPESIKVLVWSFGISLAYGFLFAGFFEEFFFRGILQTRLAQYFGSDIKGILLASIIFGLYHLPFQYYNLGIAQGNFLYALSNTLTEQMITAPIFGMLWARTQNLMAPVLLHSLIDAISLMPQIVEKYNF